MLDFGFYNMDCMDGMAQFPDKYFDLAIVDPPYGINIGSVVGGANLSHPKLIGDLMTHESPKNNIFKN